MRPHRWESAGAALYVALLAFSQPAAPALRTVATLQSLLSNAVFYHGRTVSLLATPSQVQGLWRIPIANGRSLVVSWKNGSPPASRVEVRGLFFDVGRFAEDDSRLSAYGIPAIVRAVHPEGWPPRETLFVLLNATWMPAPDSNEAGLRALTLDPDRFDGKPVTLVGRFRGQNLYGDEPVWPRQSQWDFVLQSADAVIWVTGLRPKGKDFDFDPRSRRSTDSWLSVTGVLHLAQGLPYVVAQTVQPAAAIADAPPDDAPATPALPPPALVFSAPANGELDVSPASVVRVQFTRDMSPGSFDQHVKVTYGNSATSSGTSTNDGPPAFSVAYKAGNLAVEIRFAAPLARFTQVTVEFGEGITAREGAPLAPTRITFTTGG